MLLHKRDEYAVEGWDPEDHPRSVLSGRTNDEVAGRSPPCVAFRRSGHRGERLAAARTAARCRDRRTGGDREARERGRCSAVD